MRRGLQATSLLEYYFARTAGDVNQGILVFPRRQKSPNRAHGFRGREKKRQMRSIFTIGHSTRSWEEFLEILRAHGIKRVVDVRSIPRSRHNPQFSREILSKKLRGARIGYVHLRKLGGRRRARQDSPNMGWRNTSFRGFADYMQTAEFDAGLLRLTQLADRKPSAIMCAEAVPWRCHRSLIGDALTAGGFRVEDITGKGRAHLHTITSFGRVRNKRVYYPDSKPRGQNR